MADRFPELLESDLASLVVKKETQGQKNKT